MKKEGTKVSNKGKKTKKYPLVSVVLAIKNEEKHIENCIVSINNQTYPKDKIEIIVVDNNSTDKTKEIAKKYTNNIYNKGPERSAQRNYGIIDKAKGEYALFLDADMIISPTVIEKSVNLLNDNPSTNAIYIPEIVLGKSFFSQVRRFERSFYDGTSVDCVRFIRRDTFKKIGGFDATMTGPEDWDLDKKFRTIGETIVLDKYNYNSINNKVIKINYADKDKVVSNLQSISEKGLVYHNESEFDLKKYLTKKGYYAKSFAKYIKKWGKDDPDIKKQFGLWYRYFGVFLENQKWKRLIMHPVLTIGMYFLRGMVGFVYITRNK